MGLIASHPVTATFVGDESLCRRPMDRVIAPLARLGADIVPGPGGRLPITLRGMAGAVGRDFRLTVASAPGKSALLPAGLHAPGITRVLEPLPTHDHSARLLKDLGARLHVPTSQDGKPTHPPPR